MAWEAAVNPEDCGHRGFINFAMGINKESTILASQSGMVLIVSRRNLSGLKVLKELSFFMTSPWNCFCMFKATSNNFSGWCRDSSNWVLNPISLGSILSNRPRKTEVRLYSQIVSYAKVGKALRTRTLSSSDGAVRKKRKKRNNLRKESRNLLWMQAKNHRSGDRRRPRSCLKGPRRWPKGEFLNEFYKTNKHS